MKIARLCYPRQHGASAGMVIAPHRSIYFCRMLHGRGVCRIAPPRTVAAALTASGDMISQLVLESREELDRPRLLTCAVLGGALDGSALQCWYAALHSRQPRFSLRLVAHHLAFAPAATAVFMAGAAASSLREPRRQLQEWWWPAACIHLLLIAPSQIANAFLVPKPCQVLVANSMALVWATVLSRLSHIRSLV